MTEYDLQLIAQAEALSIWNYRLVDDLIPRAQTAEARERLRRIRWELYDAVQETI